MTIHFSSVKLCLILMSGVCQIQKAAYILAVLGLSSCEALCDNKYKTTAKETTVTQIQQVMKTVIYYTT